jgi:hypothetical protein
MSRLDSFIRRLQAQRACLDRAAMLIRDLEGPVLELGLGNGRTYDHLRERLPGRTIFVFDRQIAAHPDSVPPDDCLLIGDLRETIPLAADRFGRCAALIHADIGSGDAAANRTLVAGLAPYLVRILRPGGLLASDQPMPETSALTALPLPRRVHAGRYHLYRREPD